MGGLLVFLPYRGVGGARARASLRTAVAVLLGIALSLAARSATPLDGYALVRIDPLLHVAIVRAPDGSMRALRAGDRAAGNAFHVVRLYADRVEVESGTGSQGPQRFWLSPGTPPQPVTRKMPAPERPSVPIQSGAR